MATSRTSDLASFKEGTRFLLRRPYAVLGLAALGMLLGCLPPWLQMRANLPDEDLVRGALTFAGLFPLEMYFLPRFLAEADAGAGGHPKNPLEGWAHRFDERWMRAMAGRLLFYLAFGLGLVCLVVPGLMVLFAFSWAPLRILLRGDTFGEAARGSLRMMVRGWRRVLPVALGVASAYPIYLLILQFALAYLGSDPTPWQRLTQPGIWMGNFFGTLLNVWSSACFLALFRRVEAGAEVDVQGAGPGFN